MGSRNNYIISILSIPEKEAVSISHEREEIHMHNNNLLFSFLSIFSIFMYIIPIAFLIFTVWFALKFLKLQERKNEILQTIADRLNK